MIGARMSAVVADVLVLAATWSRTWSMRTEASRINFTSTFAAILTRDGTMYFVVLLIANLIGLGLSRHIELVEPMSTWTAILTAILTSRFILDLHKAADGLGVAADAALTDLSTLPTLMFHTRTFPTEHMYGKNSVYGTVIPAIPTTATTEDSWDVSLSEEELGDARSSQKGSELLHLEEISNTTSRV
ncbi:hypothetical protein C2E23DRAFT_815610 [Lenzites betulinus]|nr:hypothetical protein C2E23DRAFT_815610 [Lenzites betulinus]